MDADIAEDETGNIGGAPNSHPQEDTVSPPQHNYSFFPHQTQNYSHCYCVDEQVNGASFF